MCSQVPTNKVLHNHIIGQPLFGSWDLGDKIGSNCCVLPVLALGEELKEQRVTWLYAVVGISLMGYLVVVDFVLFVFKLWVPVCQSPS